MHVMSRPEIFLLAVLSVTATKSLAQPRPAAETDIEKKAAAVLQSVALVVRDNDEATVYGGHAILLKFFLDHFDPKGSLEHQNLRAAMTKIAGDLTNASLNTALNDPDADKGRRDVIFASRKFLDKEFPAMMTPLRNYAFALAASLGVLPDKP